MVPAPRLPRAVRRDHDRRVGILGDGGAVRALFLIRALRATILVVCLAVAWAAWRAGATSWLGLALVVAAEETWETSVVAAALRRELRGTPSPRRPSSDASSA